MKNVRYGSRLKAHTCMKIRRSEAGIPDLVGSIHGRLSDLKVPQKSNMCVGELRSSWAKPHLDRSGIIISTVCLPFQQIKDITN